MADGAAPKNGAAAAANESPAGMSTSVGESSPPATPKSVARHSTRRTHREVIAAEMRRQHLRELSHLQGCGKQVASTRRTARQVCFASPRVIDRSKPAGQPDSGRARELSEHPMVMTPGPMTYDLGGFTPRPSPILRDWGREPRFLEDPIQPYAIPLHHSTNASPFSSTYPYAELEAGPEGATPRRPTVRAGEPQTTMDSNSKYIQPNPPSWSFGCSGLGQRFRAGTKFSRTAPVQTTSRLIGFRDRRDLEEPEEPYF